MDHQRDSRLDLMRLLGLLPLLIVASALTFALIYRRREMDVRAFDRRLPPPEQTVRAVVTWLHVSAVKRFVPRSHPVRRRLAAVLS